MSRSFSGPFSVRFFLDSSLPSSFSLSAFPGRRPHVTCFFSVESLERFARATASPRNGVRTASLLRFPPRPGRRAPTHARRLPFAHGHDGSSRACRSRSARRRLSHDRAARALCSGVCRHDGPRARRKTHGCPARTQGAPARCERVRPRRRRFARVVGRTFDARAEAERLVPDARFVGEPFIASGSRARTRTDEAQAWARQLLEEAL